MNSILALHSNISDFFGINVKPVQAGDFYSIDNIRIYNRTGEECEIFGFKTPEGIFISIFTASGAHLLCAKELTTENLGVYKQGNGLLAIGTDLGERVTIGPYPDTTPSEPTKVSSQRMLKKASQFV